MWMDNFEKLSLEDRPAKPKLTRSISDTNISPNKKVEEQADDTGPECTTLFRQYSREELGVIPGTTTLGYRRIVSELFVDLSKSGTINLPPSKTPVVKRKHREKKMLHKGTSMHTIHKRKNFPSIRKLQKDENITNISPSIKDTDKVKVEQSSSFCKTCIWLVIPTLFVIFCIAGVQISSYRKACDATLDIHTLEYFLSSNVFGQETAIKRISESLKNFYDGEYDLQVLIFTGETGVGKTYTASLLEDIFPWHHHVHRWAIPFDMSTLSPESLRKFPYCGDHLVIVDDLNEEHIMEAAEIASRLRKMKKHMIAIFVFKFHKLLLEPWTPQELLDKVLQVKGNFTCRGVKTEVVNFRLLEEKHVIKCIEEALSRNWIPVTEEAIKTVLQQLDYEAEGCKRVSSKLAVLRNLWMDEMTDPPPLI